MRNSSLSTDLIVSTIVVISHSFLTVTPHRFTFISPPQRLSLDVIFPSIAGVNNSGHLSHTRKVCHAVTGHPFALAPETPLLELDDEELRPACALRAIILFNLDSTDTRL